MKKKFNEIHKKYIYIYPVFVVQSYPFFAFESKRK